MQILYPFEGKQQPHYQLSRAWHADLAGFTPISLCSPVQEHSLQVLVGLP